MKRIEDIINLWKSWEPSKNFVSPSQVSYYYWKIYLSTQNNKPLFPSGEINDVIAVLSGSKPAATIKIHSEDEMLKEIIELSLKNGIYSRYINEKSMLIFSKNDILDEIEFAVKNSDPFCIGILLGYPQESVTEFVNKIGKIRLASHAMNAEYAKNLDVPDFKPDADWFEHHHE